MDAATLRPPRILICDDQEANVMLLERMLETAGYTDVTGTTDGERLVELCGQSAPDLILLDLHMPRLDGFEVMRQLAPLLGGPWLPIIVLTADATREAKQAALSAGARDFVTKPFDSTEVMLRIRNLLEVRYLHLELREHNQHLERTVWERTQDLEEARIELLDKLALAAEYRDDATGRHAQRVGEISALLYGAIGRPEHEVELMRYAATLHDVGKIGVPDGILLKPGRLTLLEYDRIKSHVEIGRKIVSGSRSPLLRLTEEITLSHHEKWDGTGYPLGLRGEQIPLSGRAVAIADVFDTLTHERSYKAAWLVDDAVAEICAQSGRHFDPHLVEAFMTLDHHRLVAVVEPSSPSRLNGAEQPPAAVS